MELVLIGAIFVTYGWYWGGVTEARTTAYAIGAASLILGFTAAFDAPGTVAAGSLVALGAIYGLLATANAWNESAQDRTYGLFALFFGLAAFLGLGADLQANTNMTDAGLAAMLIGGTLVLHFIAAALVPANKGFKALVGWVTLIVGVFIAIIAFATELTGSQFF
jgi:hypothetical protein